MPKSQHLPVWNDGLLPPIEHLVAWCATIPADADELHIDPVPPQTAVLPDFLSSAGVTMVSSSSRTPGQACQWRGLGGHRVGLHHPPESAPDWQGHLHCAPLPTAGLDSRRLTHEDHLIASLRTQLALDAKTQDGGDNTLVAWNPSPWSRRCVVAFPAPDHRAPWAVVDTASGARYPVQVVEGIHGSEWLVSLPMGGLEQRILRSEDEPVNGGAPWEVSEEVLDNGFVRVELDLYGAIQRLCFAGRFVDIAAPLLSVGLQAQALAVSPARVAVLEDGPVRARVMVTIETGVGIMHLTYTLHAFDPCLRVSVAWDSPEPDRWLALPTNHHGRPWRGGWGFGYEDVPRANWQHGLTWLAADDGDGGGMVIASAHPLTVRLDDGTARIGVRPGLTLVIADPKAVDPTTVIEHWVRPGVALDQAITNLGIRVVAPAGVSCVGLTLSEHSYELVLAEHLRRRQRVWVFPAKMTVGMVADLRGHNLGPATISPDGDAFMIDLAPSACLRLRWNRPI